MQSGHFFPITHPNSGNNVRFLPYNTCMSGQKILKKSFTFTNFQNWDHTIYTNAEKFFEKYGVYPNVLLAKEETFLEIDAIANFTQRDNIRDEVGSANYKNPQPGSIAHLGSFCTTDFEIRFALDEKMEFSKAKLVFDSDPDWGGEDWEDDDTWESNPSKTHCGSGEASDLGKVLRKVV